MQGGVVGSPMTSGRESPAAIEQAHEAALLRDGNGATAHAGKKGTWTATRTEWRSELGGGLAVAHAAGTEQPPLQDPAASGSSPSRSPAASVPAEPINIPAHIQVPEDCASVAMALDMAADGDIILVAPGEYRESICINKNVTLKGHRGLPKECVLISKNATTVTFCAGTGTLKNLSLRVEDTSNFFHCLVVENGEMTVQDCELSGGAWGVCINNRASATVRASKIFENKGTGVNVYGAARLALSESEVCLNRGRGISVSDAGTSVTLTGNLIHHCSDGVYVYGKASLRMEENYVHSNQDSGVTVHEAGTSAIIKRNYMQRNGWGGTFSFGPFKGLLGAEMYSVAHCAIVVRKCITHVRTHARTHASTYKHTCVHVHAGVRIYSGAGADVQDNDLQGNQSGALAIDKVSQALVLCDNNQTADSLPTGMCPRFHRRGITCVLESVNASA